MTLILSQANQYRTTLEGMSMDEYAKNSSHRRNLGGRRASTGCAPSVDWKCSRATKNRSKGDKEESDGEELSECSTIISSMELSASSLLDTSIVRSVPKQQPLPFPLEPEDEVNSPEEDNSSEKAFKDSIFHQYCNSYKSPSPSPKKDSLKQKLRFNGWEQAISPAPLSPREQRPNNAIKQKTDRRKMFSRWASTGHMCPSDDECNASDIRETRDKPPTSPVRRSPGKMALAIGVPAIQKKVSSPDNESLVSSQKSRRDYFTRRASTGVMGGDGVVVRLKQEKHTFETPESPHKNDKAPTIPDRRRQLRRCNSTGSSDSIDDLMICLTDDDEQIKEAPNKGKRKSSKTKSRRSSVHGTADTTSSSNKDEQARKEANKKKSKKKEKSSKEKKEKSRKSKDKSLKNADSPVKKISDPRDCLQNDSLFSLLGKSTCTLLEQSTHVFQAPEADPKPVSRPLRTFSRRASTGVLKGEGMVMTRKTKMGGTCMIKLPCTPGKNVDKLRSIFEGKSQK